LGACSEASFMPYCITLARYTFLGYFCLHFVYLIYGLVQQL